MKRRLRKFPQHHPSEGDHQASTRKRPPYGLIWLAVTVVVLVLVIAYDRRSISEAERHISVGRELEEQGQYMEALNAYDKAFENKRLGRKPRAQAALAMAEIYYNHLEDYPLANRYYLQARQSYPAVLSSDELQEHARMAGIKAKGANIFKSMASASDESTTPTIIQRVELISEPEQDRSGPALATYKGGEVNAGQLLRILRHRPEFHSPDFRQTPARLRDFLNNVLREDLAYEAALASGVHKDPDITTRLYDYQKQLITQRYLADRRDLALMVDNSDVEQYYNENKADFVKPGSIRLSLIKADTESSATELLQMLRDGTRFEDVATSFSQDRESAARGGDVGMILDSNTTLPVVGSAPEIVKGLFDLQVQSVSEVVPINGDFYIFRITEVHPAVNTTLAEARGRIENILRGKKVDVARHKLDDNLDEAFEPEVNNEALKQFWDYVQENHAGAPAPVRNDSRTTAADTMTTAGSVSAE